MTSSATHRCLMVLVIVVTGAIAAAAGASTQNDGIRTAPAEMAIFFDRTELPEYAILVEKSRQTLYLYEFNGYLKKVLELPCSTGQNDGPKSASGDKKTPEGVYFFVKEHPDRDLAPIYGTRAFPIDYPNVMDKNAQRGGHAIWLHGTNKELVPNDSNGCIVLRNRDINRLADYIELNRTPVIIVESMSGAPVVTDGPTRESIGNLLNGWATAVTGGAYHDYLRHYAADYLPDLSWWMDWLMARSDLHRKQIDFSVQVADASIFRYNGTYTVLFDRLLVTPGGSTRTGTLKLFLADRSGELRIVGQDIQTLPEALAGTDGNRSLAAAARRLRPKMPEEVEIARMVDGWLDAWSSKDIRAYGSFYARDFQSQGGADLEAWLAYKESLNKKYRSIRVTRNDRMTIRKVRDRRTVSFMQTYRSNLFKAVGLKELVLKREGKQWKIYREIWKKN